MKSIAIIPARYASTRFPGKPLAELGGKSIIQRVYERCMQASSLQEVIVATDDIRIRDHVEQFGGVVEMTGDHPSGTDRCAEVAGKRTADLIVNVQGDEPFIEPSDIERIVEALKNDTANIATLACPVKDKEDLDNPNVVKVVPGINRQALYFSRQPLPYLRGIPESDRMQHFTFYRHIGIYGFKREALLTITQLPPSSLEKAEALEQLRWLEAGYSISLRYTNFSGLGIDTPEDFENAKKYLK